MREPLLDKRYSGYLQESPVFFQFDDRELAKKFESWFQKEMVRKLQIRLKMEKFDLQKNWLKQLDHSLKEMKNLFLLDEQKVAYEKVVSKYNQLKTQTDQKHVIMIKGGPGTGKSVIGLNLMSYMLKNKAYVEYITPNQAFREVFVKN